MNDWELTAKLIEIVRVQNAQAVALLDLTDRLVLLEQRVSEPEICPVLSGRNYLKEQRRLIEEQKGLLNLKPGKIKPYE